MGRQRRTEVERTLPSAWNGMLAEPEEALVEILRERVEQLCGYSPTTAEVRHYLQHTPEAGRVGLGNVPQSPPLAPEPVAPSAPAETSPEASGDALPLQQLLRRDMRGRKPTALIVGNARIDVRNWSGLSAAFVGWLIANHLLTAERLPIRTYSGKDRYYIHTTPAHANEDLGGKWQQVAADGN